MFSLLSVTASTAGCCMAQPITVLFPNLCWKCFVHFFIKNYYHGVIALYHMALLHVTMALLHFTLSQPHAQSILFEPDSHQSSMDFHTWFTVKEFYGSKKALFLYLICVVFFGFEACCERHLSSRNSQICVKGLSGYNPSSLQLPTNL